MKDILGEAFREETTELLSGLEEGLLELENNPDDTELIARIFRALHTIKGSSGMFGFNEISILTHDIENIFDRIRAGRYSVNRQIIESTLCACDLIRKMLSDNNSVANSIEYKNIIKLFSCFTNDAAVDQNPDSELFCTEETIDNNSISTFRITFKPSADIFLSGTNPLLLINELLSLGSGTVQAFTDNIPFIEALQPEKCYFWWEVILVTSKTAHDIEDVFIFVEGDSEIKIEKLSSQENKKEEDETLTSYVAYTLDDNSNNQNLTSAVNKKSKQDKSKDIDTVSSIRVSAEKLDKLVNLVGELVTVQARLSQTSAELKNNELAGISEEVERLTWELRDSALNIRMVPIGTLFNKFNRLVRDLSKELGKEINLLTEGADTELDKSIIERLSDPLIHLIRNSIDHGIEPIEERIKRGKLASGQIMISARHSGTNIEIEISDDGAGIDKEAVLRKAAANGLIIGDSNLSEKDIYNLIFHPGFSTAQKVTSVSGRGVGMDVVKRTIESLRGSIDVSSSEAAGTTITLKIPLTLAIIEGLLVIIGEDHYIIPLSYVEECIELTRETKEKSHGRNLIKLRGEIIPYISLRENFEIKGTPPEIQQVVVINNENVKTGFVVDKVIGEHQTVIKSLGRFYAHIENISGATILGDGTVALILDMNKLIKEAEVTENNEK